MRPPQTGADAPQRQFIFISQGRLQDPPTVRHLLRLLDPVRNDDSCQSILDRFLTEESLYALPVVDREDRSVALVDRRYFVEFFSKPYSREIFGRRNILDLLAYEDYRSSYPIIVEDNCSVEDVAQRILDAGMQHMVTGFIVNSQGRYLGVANGHDLLNIISQRKQAELYYLAHYDSLTGVPNRALLGDRLDQACREAERNGKLVALLFIDVDRFKHINDSLGHSVGDLVLRMVVDRLKVAARSADTVARLGGDEFVILMENLESPDDVEIVVERVMHAMQAPFDLLGHSVGVTLSIGSALYPSDDTKSSALLAKADAAMYEAKSSGRNGFRKYLPGISMYNPATKLMENDLRLAIDRGELILHFQPQIVLPSQEVRGVEALVRWHHPIRGLVPPGQFIAIAEESGLIVPLGEWVVEEAFRQMQEWEAQGIPRLRVSVNISALQMNQRGFPAFLQHSLARFQIDPRLVELELTESMLMKNADEVLKTLEDIKALGVSLAIDDFGTGFSSLSYLRRFPIDRLKIDQSFVRDIERTPVNESIARAIVALADSMSLDIVAEGIEKLSELTVLEHMRCTEGQGFYFAKPLPAREMIEWLESHREKRASVDLFDGHGADSPQLIPN